MIFKTQVGHDRKIPDSGDTYAPAGLNTGIAEERIGLRLIPAVIAKSIDDLNAKVATAASFSAAVQVDFFDDRFVPGYAGPPLEEIAGLAVPPIELIAHLLAFEPLPYLGPLKDAGFSRVLFHLEADEPAGAIIKEARALGLEVGAGVNPPTDVDGLSSLAPAVDEVLFLAVEPRRPGVFVPAVLEQVRRAGQALSGPGDKRPRISVDGGVNADNIESVRQAGADLVYVGNAVFGRGDPAENFSRLVREAPE